MIKAVRYSFYKHDVWLFYGMAALLEINEKYGNASELVQMMDASTAEGREAIISAFFILSNAGAACRKHFDESESFIPTLDELRDCSNLADLSAMRDTVISAICIGVGRDVPDADGIDLDLLEFERKQKKTN